MNLMLYRTYLPGGTNGEVYQWGERVCCTIELPWRDNEPRRSCIPEGRYRLRRRYSPRYGEHLLVQGVKGRSAILVHPANDAATELQGCIAPVTLLTGEGRGSHSRIAFRKLTNRVFAALRKEEVWLVVKGRSSQALGREHGEHKEGTENTET